MPLSTCQTSIEPPRFENVEAGFPGPIDRMELTLAMGGLPRRAAAGMGKISAGIAAALAACIAAQRLFFVATAPSGAGGHVNGSPKGGATLRDDPLAHNQRGLDGLPALAPAEIEAAVIDRQRPLAEDSKR